MSSWNSMANYAIQISCREIRKLDNFISFNLQVCWLFSVSNFQTHKYQNISPNSTLKSPAVKIIPSCTAQGMPAIAQPCEPRTICSGTDKSVRVWDWPMSCGLQHCLTHRLLAHCWLLAEDIWKGEYRMISIFQELKQGGTFPNGAWMLFLKSGPHKVRGILIFSFRINWPSLAFQENNHNFRWWRTDGTIWSLH